MTPRTGRLLAVSMALVLALAVPLGRAHAAAPAAQGSTATAGGVLGAGPGLATQEPNSLTPVASCQAAKACPSCANGVRLAPVLPQVGLPTIGGPGGIQADMPDPGDTSVPPTPLGNGSWVSWSGNVWMLSVFISHQDAEGLASGYIVAGGICQTIYVILAVVSGHPIVAGIIGAACNTLANLQADMIHDLDSDGAPGFLIIVDQSGVRIYP